MTAWDDYRDPMGFLSGHKKPNEPESNAVLFSAEERVLRMRLGTWTDADQARLSFAIKSQCLQGDGLVRPAPWTQDVEGPDDHIGLGACGTPELAASVLYVFRHYPARLQYFSDRFPAIMAHLAWAAGETPGLLSRVYWAFSVAFGGKSGDQDSWLLNWLLISVAGDKGWIEQLASLWYWRRLRKAWPGGLAQVFSAYWSEEHPCAQACLELGI